jgi:hypothetical protein
MDEDKTLLRINPLPGKGIELAQTSAITRKAVLGDFPVQRSAFLEIHCPGLKSISVELDEEDSVIGRGTDCRIQLQLPNISRLHARIAYRDEEYFIQDLESTNGTLLNGVRVHKCVLRNNDQIQIGDARLIFLEEKVRKES